MLAFWKNLTCEKTLLWIQGGEWDLEQRFFEGRDVRWEKFTPVRFLHLDAAHAKIAEFVTPPFADVEEKLTDTVVLEVVLDPEAANLPDLAPIQHLIEYGREDIAPIAVYGVLPTRKVRDKQWTKFLEKLKGSLGTDWIPFPIYLNAGLEKPVSSLVPRYTVIDASGVVRFVGTNADAACNACRDWCRKMPKPDPLFAYARPVLLKDFVAKQTKAGLKGAKLQKALEMEAKKWAKKDPARAAEAYHLALGLRQAVDRRLAQIERQFGERPGEACRALQALVAEWPERANTDKVIGLKNRIAENPHIEKIARLERELHDLRAWKPSKPSDQKKKEKAIDALRKKIERMLHVKDTTIEGEAMLMLAELDNPQE